ncbi:MAG: 2-oxoacid:acceptor oxidoreductase family protein [Endomicrobiales bacterium]|nr:2-oxoacid:acceptor oxidoreductase family protein [Endomicrobiales bacterium]
MQEEIIIAGFGGQGVLFAGMLLAQAAVEEDKKTTWFPSYGAEMRGGTANSTVIISDDEIGSPVVVHPSTLIALNEPSLKKFSSRMKKGSLIIFNSSLVKEKVEFPGIKTVGIPATEIADRQIGNVKTANLVAVGAYLKQRGILKLGSSKAACEKVLKNKESLIKLNQKALESGYNFDGK